MAGAWPVAVWLFDVMRAMGRRNRGSPVAWPSMVKKAPMRNSLSVKKSLTHPKLLLRKLI
jgi:hypothetical protein